jgi:hypothetical protein
MNPNISLNSTVKWADDLVSCDLDGETALMSVETGKYYAMDPVGSRIWTLLQQPQSVSELCALLVQEFEVELPQCQEQVLAFLNGLAQDNLLKVVDEPIA